MLCQDFRLPQNLGASARSIHHDPLSIDHIITLHAVELDRSFGAVRHGSHQGRCEPRARTARCIVIGYPRPVAGMGFLHPADLWWRVAGRDLASRRRRTAASLESPASGTAPSATFAAIEPVAWPISRADAFRIAFTAREAWTSAGVSSAAIALSIASAIVRPVLRTVVIGFVVSTSRTRWAVPSTAPYSPSPTPPANSVNAFGGALPLDSGTPIVFPPSGVLTILERSSLAIELCGA